MVKIEDAQWSVASGAGYVLLLGRGLLRLKQESNGYQYTIVCSYHTSSEYLSIIPEQFIVKAQEPLFPT